MVRLSPPLEFIFTIRQDSFGIANSLPNGRVRINFVQSWSGLIFTFTECLLQGIRIVLNNAERWNFTNTAIMWPRAFNHHTGASHTHCAVPVEYFSLPH